jgi:hypothetical protein
MSSAIDPLTLDAHLTPRRTPTLTSASSALRTAQQGQFQSFDTTTPVLQDAGGGSHAIRVRCRPASAIGKRDMHSPVTVMVRVAPARTITKPTSATLGTLLCAMLDPDGCNLVAVVSPDLEGRVDMNVAIDAADPSCRVTLQHRHYCVSDELAVA